MSSESESRDKVSRLTRLAARGAIFEMGAFGLGQVLRLGSNLLLTRLLFPEAFGLMTTLTVFNAGLVMLSDVGIEQSVIQNEKGDQPHFFNTAWTLQVVRGFALYAVAIAVTYPMAWLTHEEALLWLIPVSSLIVPVVGFGSTAEFELRRRVQPKRILLLDLVAQSIGIAVMAAWAYVQPSIWALVVGNLVRDTLRTIATHFVLIPGYRNRFHWDREARDEIVRFGRWILGSSAVFFLASMSDRFVLLRVLGKRVLGVYSIAIMLSEAAFTVIGKVIQGVLLPLFARVREEGAEELRSVYYRARLRLDALAMIAIGTLAMVGPWIVDLLWDSRYANAGWMLQILCARAAMRVVFQPADTCLVALGQTKYSFLNNVARTVMLYGGIPIGYAWAGTPGVVWAVALSELPGALILWPRLARERILRLDREALAWVFFAAGLGFGYVLNLLLEWIH
ncbi:MAG: oligosaccharide flippase family protein [Myxococcota bacterium]